MKNNWILSTLLLMGLFVAGCGYKGNLYIPGSPEDPSVHSQSRSPQPKSP